MNNIFSKKVLIVINILLLITVVFLVADNNYKNRNKTEKNLIVHDKNTSYKFTNPILDCEFNIDNANSVVYADEVNKKVEELKTEHGVKYVSLYFRDLNNGPWLGINEKENFFPASLLKVPVLMAFLHQSEYDPTILQKNVKILEDDINQMFVPNIVASGSNRLIIGNSYPLLDIAKKMIQESDNDAVIVLLRNIKNDYIDDVFKSVGVPFKGTDRENIVNIKEYAGFFRVLYNSSYLNREMSELALEILSGSNYKDGIVAGVPSDIVVAHKFGERGINNSLDIQLHDCGIIYYPDRPYILCIMTRGNNLKQQEKVISELSKYIYDQVDKDN